MMVVPFVVACGDGGGGGGGGGGGLGSLGGDHGDDAPSRTADVPRTANLSHAALLNWLTAARPMF